MSFCVHKNTLSSFALNSWRLVLVLHPASTSLMVADAQPVVANGKWRRFYDTVLDPNDSEMRDLIKKVDRCFGAGGYMINNINDYPSQRAFACGEDLCLRRLKEFLHLVGDMKIRVPWVLMEDEVPEDITMDVCLDTDVLFAVRALDNCALVEDEGSTKRKLCGIIIKMALFYARNKKAKIPRSLLHS